MRDLAIICVMIPTIVLLWVFGTLLQEFGWKLMLKALGLFLGCLTLGLMLAWGLKELGL